MALKIVGSGLGRTGTFSLKLALERLGFGPCHHMVEVFEHPETVPLWVKAGGGAPDWDAIFVNYRSAVDYPTARFWRELAAYYPDARILHTVRDPNSWFESTQETIFAPNSFAANPPEPFKRFFGMISDALRERIDDRDFMTAYFARHTEDVRAAIAPERLLVYEVTEGWQPLCAFLGVQVPDAPFPQKNTREEFKARAAAQRRARDP